MGKNNIPKSRNWTGKIAKTPGRLIGIGIIRIYQLIFSNIFGNSCRYFPTCSEYGYESIARHGLWIGAWFTLCRLARCNPLGSYGFNPVPDHFTKKRIIITFWGKINKIFYIFKRHIFMKNK
ncbi:membrane protein insertion efficiency factor YidD [Candidatus Liberibacter africanus]|uniref:Putative membrane protein insertion efficiency factor n=1 Tax=Candidatus Liberibacter africanus PTSAPSY TaxID=1277257 RepID=A0A0G3I5A9_LIBAF|nr:hypothetical protein G293_03930 [Candidatus Liberibacter africanus PTSAPSY]AKK20415.1 hypothetical protein G293_03955 [Candidatus Liberibacter africanus PTSAPSY]QTP64142.1 membrane protein insertion efficiency factor YidD [Candidatus Liberibacter africanus]